MYSITRTLQEIESLSYIRQLQYSTGVIRPIKKINIDQQLDAMKGLLRDQTTTVVQYADACSYCVHL
ncbi:hypothetical protein DPMN_114097 [Dreissena polymorpha]|uniref:Uncharacterized protein n=1 Tax=Dreissena polymorpha TaxID=45954 RepID=A0A9D4QRE5_DREPO|nr:hypothetical protein DPMN_114097 [Dreissena polymorpha]